MMCVAAYIEFYLPVSEHKALDIGKPFWSRRSTKLYSGQTFLIKDSDKILLYFLFAVCKHSERFYCQKYLVFSISVWIW